MEKEFISIAEKYWTGFLAFLPGFILALISLMLGIFISRKTSRLINNRLKLRLEDLLLVNFLTKISKWIIILIAFVVAMQLLGLATLASGLIAGAGVSAIVIGFAFKDIGENFLSGVILAFNRPFKIGDVIVTEDITGTIVSLDLRTTTIKTFEGFDVFVPNSIIINNPLVNYNREGTRRFDFIVGIDYDDDVSNARNAILERIFDVSEVLKDPKPFVIVNELSSSSTNLRIFYWVNASAVSRNLMEIKSEVIESTVKAFKDKGVRIPFDSVQVQFKKDIPEIPVTVKNSN